MDPSHTFDITEGRAVLECELKKVQLEEKAGDVEEPFLENPPI